LPDRFSSFHEPEEDEDDDAGGLTGQFDMRPIWGHVADITTTMAAEPDGTYHFADCRLYEMPGNRFTAFVHLMEDPRQVSEPQFRPCPECAAERVADFWRKRHDRDDLIERIERGEADASEYDDEL
jgi:hypothetical protein